MSNRYIGVEQEFVSFLKLDPFDSISFNNYFKKMRAKEESFFKISETSIRTGTGHAIYVDQNEIEVCTPPVRINTGFATRLTDLVMIGREKVINAVPELNHTGLSMHWNVSLDSNCDRFYAGMALPFHLFGLTPVSSALNMRSKGPRAEFLGDYLTNEDQINALALLFGSYSYAFDANLGRSPILLDNLNKSFSAGNKHNLFAPDGRFSQVSTVIHSLSLRESMPAQKYLEYFYQWVEPFAKQLGTNEEVSNLEAFIFGEKKLEFDSFKYFANLLDLGGKKRGTYYPIGGGNQEIPSKTLRRSGKERTLPLEGKLFGSFVVKEKENLRKLHWDTITSDCHRELCSIDEIYEYATRHFEKDCHLEPSPEIPRFSGDYYAFKELQQKGPKEYNPLLDNATSDSAFFLRKLGRVVRSNTLTRKGILIFAFSSLLGLPITHLAKELTNRHIINETMAKLEAQYTRNSTNTSSVSTNTPAIPTVPINVNNSENKK